MMKRDGMRGMTLVELMTVIAVMAVIAGFGSLSMDMVRREEVSSATRELYADLQKARLDAMTKEGKGYGVRFESAGSYVIFKFDDCDNDYTYDRNACAGKGREEKDAARKIIPSSVVLRKTNPSTAFSDHVLLFDRFGVPRNENGSLGLLTVVVKQENDAFIKCVSVSLNRIREGAWGWDHKASRYTCIEQ